MEGEGEENGTTGESREKMGEEAVSLNTALACGKKAAGAAQNASPEEKRRNV